VRPLTTFIFRVTSTCDKGCVLCCNNFEEIKRFQNVPFNAFLSKIVSIKTYVKDQLELGAGSKAFPYIILTGGEALLYRSRKASARVTLFELIDAIVTVLPNAAVVVKTGGFEEGHKFQLTLFERISNAFSHPRLEWRFGWNLYQGEERALERFVLTAGRIMSHQNTVFIDTIYDATNLRDTFTVMEKALMELGVSGLGDDLVRFVLQNPERHRRIRFLVHEHAIIVDVGPSYPPNEASSRHEYYSESPSECVSIMHGTDYLYYDVDLRLVHCNDSYVDARIPAAERFGCSIGEDHDFLNARFQQLADHLVNTEPVFRSRQERCFFCTKFIMAGVGDAGARSRFKAEPSDFRRDRGRLPSTCVSTVELE